MSEQRETGVREREERFGHVVLETHAGEVYSLDLYETHETYAPGLACRGYYLSRRRNRRVQPVPVGVDLSMDDDAFNAIYEMLGAGRFGGPGNPWDPDASYSGDFELGGPWRDVGPVFHAEVSAPLRLLDKTVRTGMFSSKEGQVTGQFDFILEQYGTIEPAALLLIFPFFLLFYERNAKQQAEECYQQALRQCGGAGNIKSLNTTSGITGMTLRVDRGCQYECFERWPSSEHEGGDPPEGREDGP